ncbi:amino acid permease [Nonomuraea sp. NPDC026600]|uniref:APC family permease n=1 Tax=Nonomuraea sp. NPDC026600 TaxID=3155363 RepID=UPI003408B099
MSEQTQGRLSAGQGTAMLLGGVLGPGMLVLPQLAAKAAGPASILAWVGLLALSAPVAITFATLGARYPNGGGVAAFTGLAFGGRAAAVAGWWFYGAVPLGIVAGAQVGAVYVAATLGVDQTIAAGTLLAAAFLANAAGLRTSGRLQMTLVLLLIALLATAVATAAPHASAANFTPFAPYGLAGVVSAAGVLFFAFVGWEAATHLSAEIGDIRRATTVTLLVIAVLYLSVSITSIAVLGRPAPMSALLATGIGAAAGPITMAAAIALTFGAINTYIAGAARLGASMAGNGSLPSWFGKGGTPGQTPYRSLALLAALTGLVMLWPADLDTLMRATSACLAAVTTAGVAAATRILPPGKQRNTAVAATALSCIALACCGTYLAVPAALSLIALLAAKR